MIDQSFGEGIFQPGTDPSPEFRAWQINESGSWGPAEPVQYRCLLCGWPIPTTASTAQTVCDRCQPGYERLLSRREITPAPFIVPAVLVAIWDTGIWIYLTIFAVAAIVIANWDRFSGVPIDKP